MTEYARRVEQRTQPHAARLGHLTIELTERCNNDCLHCCINRPANDAGARAREMTTEQVQDIMRQAADLGCWEVHLTGGEPLLRPDFEDLYVFARRLGMNVLLFTNGRLINPRLAALFARVPPRVEIQITVYGMRAESYEAVTRAPGSFAQFWRGIRLLSEHRVPFRVKCALLPPNRAEMDEFEAGSPAVPWKLTRPTYSTYFDLRSRRDDRARNRLIESLRMPAQESLAVMLRDAGRFRPWPVELMNDRLRPPGDALFSCGAPTGESPCVDAYGRLQPCIGIRAPELTVDLGLAPLHDALTRFARLSEMRATNAEYLRRCARCSFKTVCEQCPAKSWTEHGTFDAPVEHLCAMMHAWARYLGWLGDGEHGWEVSGWREGKVATLRAGEGTHTRHIPKEEQDGTGSTSKDAVAKTRDHHSGAEQAGGGGVGEM